MGRLTPIEQVKSKALWRQICSKRQLIVDESDSQLHPHSTNTAVMLVQRRLPNLRFVINQCRVYLGGDWSVQIFCPPKFGQWVAQQISVTQGVRITELFPSELAELSRDQLMRESGFWNLIQGENLLFLGHDLLMCRSFPHEVFDFDFIAPLRDTDWISPWCRFGDGECSFRKKSTMIQICKTCNTRTCMFPMEGAFFSMVTRLEGSAFRIPNDEFAAGFIVEQFSHPTPFLLNAPWRYMTAEKLYNQIDQISW